MSLEKTIAVEKRSELLTVTSAMIDGRMNLIEGVRRICVLRGAIGDSENPVFIPIRAIESETDHFPLGETRVRYSADYLQRIDDEMQSYLSHARQDILSACREIVRVFSTTTNRI